MPIGSLVQQIDEEIGSLSLLTQNGKWLLDVLWWMYTSTTVMHICAILAHEPVFVRLRFMFKFVGGRLHLLSTL